MAEKVNLGSRLLLCHEYCIRGAHSNSAALCYVIGRGVQGGAFAQPFWLGRVAGIPTGLVRVDGGGGHEPIDGYEATQMMMNLVFYFV